VNIIEKAIKLAKMFTDYAKGKNQTVMEEIKIHSDQPNERFIIKIFITEDQEEVIFKKEKTNAYIIISNGKPIGIKNEEDFRELFSLLEIAGAKLIEKTLKEPKRKKQKNVLNLNKKKKMNREHKIDRLLDKYNDYQILYEMFEDEYYLKRRERLISLLKKRY